VCYYWPVDMKFEEIKVKRSVVTVFKTFKDAEEADRQYWHSRSSDERLLALELMRQSAYGYEYSTSRRLQGVLEIISEK
jgi:hypothetical protein